MSKHVITFAFRSDVSYERMNEILAKVSAWREVDQAAHLQPESKIDSLLRLSYLYVKDEADPNKVCQRLARIKEIESASSPAKRKLV